MCVSVQCRGSALVHTVDVSREGSVVQVRHFNTLAESMLVYATQHGVIHGWDLRAQREAWQLDLDPSLGMLCALSTGPSQCALLAGTSRGFVALWDLRYQVKLQLWRHSSAQRITHLSAHDVLSTLPQRSTGNESALAAAALQSVDGSVSAIGPAALSHPTSAPLFFVSAYGTNEVGAFDCFTGECREIFRAPVPVQAAMPMPPAATTATATATATAVPSSSAAGSSVAAAFGLPSLASYIQVQRAPLNDGFLREVKESCSQFGGEQPSMTGFLCSPGGFVVTAGSDRIVRHFNMRQLDRSAHISGPPQPAGSSVRYHGSNQGSVVVFEEVVSSVGGAGSAVGGSKAHPPSDVIPSYHMDSITDLKAIEFPQQMLATSSRDGVIKVWG